jgi:hypothetical protein
MITTPEGVTYPFTYANLIATTLGSLYSSYSWPDLAQFLADLESMMPATALGGRLYAIWGDIGFVNKRGVPHYTNYLEPWPAITCADTSNPSSYAVWSAVAGAADAAGDHFTPPWTWYSSVCVPWVGAQADRYAGPFDAWTSHPVLLTNTMFDPATRYQNALLVAGLLPNSRLMTVHGWGHTTPFLSQQADAAVSEYLLRGTLPANGTVFEQDYVPFTPGVLALTSSTGAETRAQMIPPNVPSAVHRSIRTKGN